MKKLFYILPFIFILGCGEDEKEKSPLLDCANEESPYDVRDMGADTAYYNLDYWWWLEDSTDVADTAAIYRDIDNINMCFENTFIQFELGEIRAEINPRNYLNQKDYRRHGYFIEEWYYENRNTEPYALFVVVYPTKKGLFPGAALGIPSQGYCVQEKFLGTSTSVHEMGHVFGTYHTHTEDLSESGGRSFFTGDAVPLPYHPPIYKYMEDGCNTLVNPYQELTDMEEGDLIHNFMSYSRFYCRDRFTQNQIDRMRWISNHSPELERARIN